MEQQQRKPDMNSCFNLLLLFLMMMGTGTAASQSVIQSLPGYPGTLPFKLQTGYISLGENDEKQVFYYFIESENDPQKDPLLLWLTGGPGCTGLSALLFEIGPLVIDAAAFDESFPSLTLNPYSWTKIANIIFIDSPIGTGFSYATTLDGYTNSDTIAAKDNHMFLRKWLSIHPAFFKNRLYLGGSSYGGKIVPMVALEIAEGNEAGLQPRLLLQIFLVIQDNAFEKLNQGYMTGNAITDVNTDKNERIPYAHRMALISDEYFELAKSSCRGEYVNPDPDNGQCAYALDLFEECTSLINVWHILEAKCNFKSPKPNRHRRDRQLVEDDPVDSLLSLSKKEKPWCRHRNYVSVYVWANNVTVQEALHIRKGTIGDWNRCNGSINYEYDVKSVLKHHQLLSNKGFQALAYSGDHDMAVPYMSTLKWIRSLNLTLDDEWRPWTVDGQVAGYTEKYKNNQAYLTFATVKGAGHTATEYKPKESFEMLERWLSLYPL